jgi:hypothetical protein
MIPAAITTAHCKRQVPIVYSSNGFHQVCGYQLIDCKNHHINTIINSNIINQLSDLRKVELVKNLPGFNPINSSLNLLIPKRIVKNIKKKPESSKPIPHTQS